MEPAITAVGAMAKTDGTKANAWNGKATIEGDHLVIRLPSAAGFLLGDVVVRENEGRLIVERRKLTCWNSLRIWSRLTNVTSFPT